MSGTGGTFEFGKQGGGHWMYVAGFTWRSPGLELNDIGYLRQTDVSMQYVWAGYRIYEPLATFRSVNINFNQWSGCNFGGETIFKGGNINLNFQLKNYWSGGFGVNRNFKACRREPARRPVHARPRRLELLGECPDRTRKAVRFTLMGRSYRRDNGESGTST